LLQLFAGSGVESIKEYMSDFAVPDLEQQLNKACQNFISAFPYNYVSFGETNCRCYCTLRVMLPRNVNQRSNVLNVEFCL